MLLEFRVKNYRTFKEEAVFSMIASNYDKSEREEENITVDSKFKLRILKSAAFFGANASGKSKFMDALSFVQWFTLNSFQSLKIGDPIPVNPHLLSYSTENQPSSFELVFLQEGSIFRYGFEVNPSSVIKEWLFKRENRKEILIFERENDEINAHPVLFKISKNEFFKPFIRSNCLLLSSAAQANNEYVEKIIRWFKRLKIFSGIESYSQEKITVSRSLDPQVKERILNFLISGDVGIVDYNVKSVKPYEGLGSSQVNIRADHELFQNPQTNINAVTTTHLKFDEKTGRTEEIEFSMVNDESGGTRKFFSLAYPIIEAITEGNTLVIDELDSNLHPNLSERIVNLFNSLENMTGAQLIFNTHNTNILNSKLIRRDQVWFIEKDIFGAAKLYSLSDIQVRKNDKFEKEYLEGRYGAVPYLTEMQELISNSTSKRQFN